jgi:two-component system, chemotaxis family, response regulator WspR
MCREIAGERISHATSPTAPYVTISVGVATATPDGPINSSQALLETADARLYASKKSGRNHVTVD